MCVCVCVLISQGGNDHEIFVHPAVKGHTVTDPENTVELVRQVLETL